MSEAGSDTPAGLRRKIFRAQDLQAVVRTMRAVASSNITGYENSVLALAGYYQSIELGLGACFRSSAKPQRSLIGDRRGQTVNAIVFGSDQGLVGQFNDEIALFAVAEIKKLSTASAIWAVGERVAGGLQDLNANLAGRFEVPREVDGIASLVREIFKDLKNQGGGEELSELHLYFNRPVHGASYQPFDQKLLPLDEAWRRQLTQTPWPGMVLPEVLGPLTTTLRFFIREYLFVSVFRASAESLASENASRLVAMQRADKNIDELLRDLNSKFHRLRQDVIDEELFDVVSSFEAIGSTSH